MWASAAAAATGLVVAVVLSALDVGFDVFLAVEVRHHSQLLFDKKYSSFLSLKVYFNYK